MILEEDVLETTGANLKAIGIGGCGGNAIQYMIDNRIDGVEFICANTDSQDLSKSTATTKIPLGKNLTKGRGAGSKPETGREACLESSDHIKEVLQGTEMLFLTAGMGGGTGTGASPVIAAIAKELKILCVAIVTTPFSFEGTPRMKAALAGISELTEHVDSIIVVPNEKLLTELSPDISMEDAYRASDSILKGAVYGIANIIKTVGKVNLDFEDVRTVMSESGQAIMGTGESSGVNRAEEAASLAVNSPLLNDIDIKNAKALLVNVSASKKLTLREYAAACNKVKEMASEDAMIITGDVLDESLGEKMKVTVIATGLNPSTTDNISKDEVNNDIKHYAKIDGSLNLPEKLDANNIKIATTDEMFNGMDFIDVPTFLRKQTN